MLVYFIITILLLVGLFFIFNISPKKLTESMDEITNNKGTNITKQAVSVQKNKKKGFIEKFFSETYQIMEYMHAKGQFVIICFISLALVIIGSLFISGLNGWCIPAWLVFCVSLPFIYVHKLSFKYSRDVLRELEISLNQITTSYIRSEKILESVEENLSMINSPIYKPFQEFVSQLKYVNPNEIQAIEDLEEKIDDNIFKEWCKSFKQCANNRTLKYLLSPSLEKFSTIKELDEKIKFDLFGIKFSYWVLVGIVYVNFPVVRLLNKDWFAVLTDTQLGLATIGLIALITVICSIILFFITKPIKYKL